MDFNYNYRKKDKKNKKIFIVIIIIIAILISSFAFKNSSNTIVNKVANIINTPFKHITNIASNISKSAENLFSSKEELIKENDVLKKENNNLKLEKIQTAKVIEENESLKKMLEIENKYNHYELCYGKIVLRNHDNYTNTLMINVGSKSGIELYDAVIHKDGLVGYISSVTEETSVVTTILDPSISISIIIATINEYAMLKGNITDKINNQMKLEYVPINSEISIGDMLYTSGLGSMYYSSIPVAKIISVVNKKNESDRYALAEPVVNINAIKEVSVVIE